MLDRFSPVWLLTKRELRDQFRDWRVLFPLFVIPVFFPFLMNEVAKETVNFVSRFGATLLVDRLVPFSILIIGFFPVTVSLVVALESFVGEKERGTIEPLLSAPLENWQLYFGKLLVGIFTPLTASYLSISLYIFLVSHQKVMMPPWYVIFQLFALTTVHAILMVSAAIVISVQSTSVKAANLLASFIVIPVAILMQGESVMLFWGNDQVLWLAVAGVLILSALLVRVGIAHFQREYLLGREIDVINLRWVLKTFWKNFKGQAHSFPGWYAESVMPALRRLRVPMLYMLLIAGIGIWFGHYWIVSNIPTWLSHAKPDDLSKLVGEVKQTPDFTRIADVVSAPYLFFHNVRAVLSILLAGLFSFSVLGLVIYLVNIGLIGGLFGLFQILGLSAWTLVLAGIVPHGIFEIPALMLGSAAVLRIGAALVTPQTGKSMGEVVIELLTDWAKIFIGLVVPLLAIAAVVEAYITPAILRAVVK